MNVYSTAASRHQQRDNPLRISSESLNLDDIISDLNTNDLHQDTAALQRPTTSSSSQMEPTITPKPLTKKPASLSKPTTAATKNKAKENTNSQNKPATNLSVGKTIQDKQQKDFQISTTTTAVGGQETTTTQSESQQVSQRYDNSHFKNSTQYEGDSEIMSSNHKVQQQQQQELPFYMQRSAASGLTDEDVEQFQKKLDTMLINFRSETLGEFMRTKKQVVNDQASAIDAERRRCNTLLGVKQNEIEQLKESLGNKTKHCEELQTRCEAMSFWSGKSKMLLRIKLLQHKSFEALKAYCHFKKHNKLVLQQKLKQYREDLQRKAFLGWEKQYKEWKVVKNREDFEKAVKLELQNICAQYNKEIESLREKLNEAQSVVDQETKNKAMMQENLKKAFMRGVCALNFEAMSILTPGDSTYQLAVEREMEKQVANVMSGITGGFGQNSQMPSGPSSMYGESAQKQQMFQSRVPQQFGNFNDVSSSYDNYHQLSTDQISERKFMQIDAQSDLDYKKIETKDSMWKPAPIMGRDLSQQQPNFTYQQPQITQNLRSQQQNSYVLPSSFTRLDQQQQQFQDQNPQFRLIQEDTSSRTQLVEPSIIQTGSLPDFVGMAGGLPQVNNQNATQSEGKTIFAGSNTNNGTAGTAKNQRSGSTIGAKKTVGASTSVNVNNKKK